MTDHFDQFIFIAAPVCLLQHQITAPVFVGGAQRVHRDGHHEYGATSYQYGLSRRASPMQKPTKPLNAAAGF